MNEILKKLKEALISPDLPIHLSLFQWMQMISLGYSLYYGRFWHSPNDAPDFHWMKPCDVIENRWRIELMDQLVELRGLS